MFFVEDQRVAMQLKQVGKLSSSGGELSVVVKPSAPPSKGKPFYLFVCSVVTVASSHTQVVEEEDDKGLQTVDQSVVHQYSSSK